MSIVHLIYCVYFAKERFYPSSSTQIVFHLFTNRNRYRPSRRDKSFLDSLFTKGKIRSCFVLILRSSRFQSYPRFTTAFHYIVTFIFWNASTWICLRDDGQLRSYTTFLSFKGSFILRNDQLVGLCRLFRVQDKILLQLEYVRMMGIDILEWHV